MFLEACSFGRMHDSIGWLHLIGVHQQYNDMVHTTNGKNLHAWIVQCNMHSKLNVADLEKVICLNSMYLCSDIGV